MAWKKGIAALALCGALAGCGQATDQDPDRYGMQVFDAADRTTATMSADDFLIVGNSVFLAAAPGRDVSAADVQANFRGMRAYRVDDEAGLQAMNRLQRALGGSLPAQEAARAGADLETLLRTAKNWDDGK